jgi:HD-GYP domain-containing protein (c-di-GMP phosphodiesterase class II)
MINLSYGALIHDIGKIHVASDILNKPGKITSLEYQLLQTHAEYSYNIVREMGLPQDIATMVHQHHERLDGSGYPNHVSGDQILLESRILAVADVVEAMTSHRPYRPALGIEAALAEIQAGRGTKFDEIVVDHCVSLFREEGFQFNKETDEAV